MSRQLTYFGVGGLILGSMVLCAVVGALGWYTLTNTWGKPVRFISAAIANNPVSEVAMYSVESEKFHVCAVGRITRWIVDDKGVRHAVAKFMGSNQLEVGRNSATFPVAIPSSIPNLRGLFYTEVNYQCPWGFYAVVLPPGAIEIRR